MENRLNNSAIDDGKRSWAEPKFTPFDAAHGTSGTGGVNTEGNGSKFFEPG